MNVAKVCNYYIHPFPGENGSFPAAQKGGERDGGKGWIGKVLCSVGIHTGLFDGFPGEKRYPCVHNQH